MGTPEPQKNNKKRGENPIVVSKTVIIFAICICLLFLVTQFQAIQNMLNWLGGILAPVFVGVILAYIINPLAVWCEKILLRKGRLKEKAARGISITIAVIVLIGVITLLIVLIIPEFLQSLYTLVGKVPSLVESAMSWIDKNMNSDSVFLRNFGEYVDSAVNAFASWLSGEFSSALAGLIGGVVSVASFLVNFLISIVICVYALLEKKKFIAQMKKVVFAFFSHERANDILDVSRYGNEIFGKFVVGKLITSAIVGVFTFVFMLATGMPYALISAVIIAITNVIPFFGPFIGGIPTAFVVLITDLKSGIIYIIFLVVLQQIEGHIIEPKIMEDKTGVSKFWVTVALLFCGGIFGIAGMIFSVPLFAILYYCIKIFVERRLAKKELPLVSDEYLEVGSIDPETNRLQPNPQKPPKQKFSFKNMFKRKQNQKEPDNDQNNDNDQQPRE